MNYWVFLCNPDKWYGSAHKNNIEVNEILYNLTETSWGVTAKNFVNADAGDLGIIKVGVDNRPLSRLPNGKHLESGIYAIVEIVKNNTNEIDIKVIRNLYQEGKTISIESAKNIFMGFGYQASQRIAKNPEEKFDRLYQALDIKDEKVSEKISQEHPSYFEGNKKLFQHFKAERDSRVSKLAKQQRLQETGELRCDICDFSFLERYGEIGEGYIEAHHTIPMAAMGERETHIDEIALVCSNCHRMLHSCEEPLTVDELRKHTKKGHHSE